MGVKDVMVVQGAPSTAGSKILQGYRPPYDCTAVARLEAAGAAAQPAGSVALAALKDMPAAVAVVAPMWRSIRRLRWRSNRHPACWPAAGRVSRWRR